MDAYYYSFDPTGERLVDEVLSAVAWAGKAYHHTGDWNKECGGYYGPYNRGDTPVGYIQPKAAECAATLTDLHDRLAAAERERDEWKAKYEIANEVSENAHRHNTALRAQLAALTSEAASPAPSVEEGTETHFGTPHDAVVVAAAEAYAAHAPYDVSHYSVEAGDAYDRLLDAVRAKREAR
jgi:hypothetical protein